MPKQYNVKSRPAIRVIGPSIAYIPLTRGQVTLVDSWWADRLERNKWFALFDKSSGSYYAKRKVTTDDRSQADQSMHLLISGGHGNDHENGNTLDNRECNLRSATARQQTWNRRSKNKLGLKGVHQRGPNRFRAQIRVNGVVVRLGNFSTAEAGHDAYKAAAIKHFGLYARW